MTAEILSHAAIIPAQLLCLFPVRNQLRFTPARTLGLLALLDLVLFPLSSFFIFRYSLNANSILFPLLLVFFTAYHLSLKCSISKSLAVAIAVCALMSALSNITCAIESRVAPDSGANILTVESALIQFSLNAAAAGLLYYPLKKYGARLIDSLDISAVWYMTIPFSLLILGINLFNRPLKFQTLFVNNVFRAFLVSIFSTLLLWILLCVMFYYIVTSILTSADRKMKLRLLEMKESQFISQQRYIEASARARHDFRQSILTIRNLCREKNYQALEEYIEEYANFLPHSETRQYCRDHALNALLNYYAGKAGDEKTKISFRIDIPDILPVSDVDLCSIVGNILENAITACSAVPEEQRHIHLAMLVQNGNRLFIVATNSYSGPLYKRNGSYLSSHRHGKGIGLRSIAETAAKYGGKSEFSHNDSEFHSNVMLPLDKS